MPTKQTQHTSAWRFVKLAFAIRTKTPVAHHILLVLANHCDQTGYCFPSYEEIMVRTGYTSKTTVSNALKELRDDFKLLTWEKGWGNKQCHKANSYRLQYEAMTALKKKQSEDGGEPPQNPPAGPSTPSGESPGGDVLSTPAGSAESTPEFSKSTDTAGESSAEVGKSTAVVGESDSRTLTSHTTNVPSLPNDPSLSNDPSLPNVSSLSNVPFTERPIDSSPQTLASTKEVSEKRISPTSAEGNPKEESEQKISLLQSPAECEVGGDEPPPPRSAPPPSPGPKTEVLRKATEAPPLPRTLKEMFPAGQDERLYRNLSDKELREMLSDEHWRLLDQHRLWGKHGREVMIGMLRHQRIERQKAASTPTTASITNGAAGGAQ